MTLYNLIKVYRGKKTIVMTDSLSKVRNRKLELGKSQSGRIKGYKVEYLTEEVEEGQYKFKQKGHDPKLSGQSKQYPRLVKWNE